MKSASLGLCMLIVMCAGASAKAQCGCGASVPTYYAPSAPVHSHYRPPAPPRSYPGATMGGSTIAYVNKLATPVPRANYTLNYAVHLTDGRILLSDFLPPGQTVRGIESQSGAGGRRLNTANTGSNITVTDPSTNSTVVVF